MAIAKHGRLAGGVQPVGVHQGMLGGGNHFHVFQAGGLQAVGSYTESLDLPGRTLPMSYRQPGLSLRSFLPNSAKWLIGP